jgi:hypothetical protein
MKKFITSAILVLIITFYLPACKKSDKAQTTLEKIQGKWQLVTDVENDHIAGQDDITTYTGGPSDIIDFRADGKAYFNIIGTQDTDTLGYTVSGDTKIVFEATQFDIITLTSNLFIIHDKEVITGSDFTEETITLKK